MYQVNGTFSNLFLKVGRVKYNGLLLALSQEVLVMLTCGFFYEMGTLSLQVGEGNGTPLQYSCLENPMDGGAW